MIENLAVIGIVLLAAAYVGRTYLKKLRTRGVCGCGCSPDTCPGSGPEKNTPSALS